MTPIHDPRPDESTTPLEDLGCPHCGVLCDVCVDTDAEVKQLRAELDRLRSITTGDPMTVYHEAAVMQKALNAIALRCMEVPPATPSYHLARGVGQIAVDALEKVRSL